MWDIAPDDELTVVGIQKGNTLTYCDKVTGGISKDCIVSEDEMTDSANRSMLNFYLCTGSVICDTGHQIGAKKEERGMIGQGKDNKSAIKAKLCYLCNP